MLQVQLQCIIITGDPETSGLLLCRNLLGDLTQVSYPKQSKNFPVLLFPCRYIFRYEAQTKFFFVTPCPLRIFPSWYKIPVKIKFYLYLNVKILQVGWGLYCWGITLKRKSICHWQPKLNEIKRQFERFVPSSFSLSLATLYRFWGSGEPQNFYKFESLNVKKASLHADDAL